MIKLIMHGCNGKMGQVISRLLENDEEACLVAGIDARDDGHNPYPVFTDIKECNVEADALIDFSAAPAVDALLSYCVEKKLPCVLCTTGLSEEQLKKVKEASGQVAILKSANMSLGINLLLKLLKEASEVLVKAGFDVEIVEKHHNQKVDASVSDKLFYVDLPLAEEYRRRQDEDESTEDMVFPAGSDTESMDDPHPVGIDVSGCTGLLRAYGYTKEDGPLYIGIVRNSKRTDAAVKFVQFLFSSSENNTLPQSH